MEIRQIKKEIEGPTCLYHVENREYVSTIGNPKKSCWNFVHHQCKLNSHERSINFGLADEKSNGNTANKEQNLDIRPRVIFRREWRKYREILFNFNVQEDLLFNLVGHDFFYLPICFELHAEEIWSAESWNGIFGHMLSLLCSKGSSGESDINIVDSDVDILISFSEIELGISIFVVAEILHAHLVLLSLKRQRKSEQ